MLVGFDDKTANAVCTFAYCSGDVEKKENILLFRGITPVQIITICFIVSKYLFN